MDNDDNSLRGAYDIDQIRRKWDALDSDDSPPAWLVIVYTLLVAWLGAWVLDLYGAWL